MYAAVEKVKISWSTTVYKDKKACVTEIRDLRSTQTGNTTHYIRQGSERKDPDSEDETCIRLNTGTRPAHHSENSRDRLGEAPESRSIAYRVGLVGGMGDRIGLPP